ncbi:MAG: M15 family metallopeptidase, partial [Mycobacteriales bacterium]
VPLDVSAAEPAAYARLMPGAGAIARLRPGTAILGATSAALRSLGPGADVRFGSVHLRVLAVAPDVAVGYAELFITPADATRLGLAGPRYLLVGPGHRGGWTGLATSIRHLLPAATPVRLRAPGQARWLREGDAVLPPVLEKARFGEFTVGRHSIRGGQLETDPAWQRRHVVTATVPLLGRVTCNQAIVGPLSAALGDLQRSGLGALVRRRDYGGCYVPRLIPGLPGAAISHHAWGSAIDINVSANPYGGRPRQDPRLVAIFARHGFAWGGDWLVPDGMHFDWLGG